MKRIFSVLLIAILFCGIASATVTDQTQRVQYTATTDQTVFAYTWRVLDDDDMDVFIDGVISIAYSVSNVGVLSGGNITFNSGRTSGEIITILRNMPETQETSYPAGGRLSTVNLELNLDRLTMLIQDLEEQIRRATKMPGTDTLTNIDYPIGTSATDRATKIAAWNSDGTKLELIASTNVDATSVIAVQGDLVQGNSSGAAAKLAVGSTGDLVTVSSGSWITERPRNVAWSKGTDIAGAAALPIPDEDANYWDVTGTPSITSISATNLAVGAIIRLHFDTVASFTHDATNLVLPDGLDITVSVDDEFTFIQYATDDYRLVATTSAGALAIHTHADNDNGGNTLTIPTIGDFTNATHTHRTTAQGGDVLTLGTEDDSLSGTAIDFLSIPSGVKKITIMFVGVSLDGNEELLIQIGDAGGIETSGYLSTSSDGSSKLASTAGFVVHLGGATGHIMHGSIILTLEDAVGFTWTSNGNLNRSDTAVVLSSAGSKSLSAELDRVRITSTGTPDDFDAGAINIQFE